MAKISKRDKFKIQNKLEKFIENQKDIPEDIAKIIDDNFMELL